MGAIFDPPVTLTVWGTERSLKFADAQDVNAWAEAEIVAWEQIKQPSNGRLLKLLNQQKSQLAAIRASANEFNQNTLLQQMDLFKTGALLTSDHHIFPVVQRIGTVDGDSAMLLALSARSDGANQFQAMGFQPPFDLLIRFVALAFRSESEDRAPITAHSELARLKNTYDSSLSDSRAAHADLEKLIAHTQESLESDRALRTKDWSNELLEVRKEWTNLKLVYDTELGLRAPTTYWTDRAKSHRWQAVGFGAAFAISLAILVIVFSELGLTYLVGVPSDKPAVLAVLPVLIPAFAGIWVLRILGRLLSESFHLMRDASERETLVKTFLALMKDDVTGKSVVKDEDRILILHSLFRPSNITAADDAPPVHWFDILANKVGQKKSP